MSTGAVIVAAGLSSRMGKLKALMPFEDTTIARHIVKSVQRAGADPVVVVTGYRANELEKHLAGMGVRFVRNERYQDTQMFDSIKLGIRSIADGCDKLMILPVDTPAISQKTFRQVLMIDADMVRTVYGGHPGHPILLKSHVAKELCSYQGDRGLRGAMEESGFSITGLNVDDKGVSWDVDTQIEYQELIAWNNKRKNGYPIRPQTMIRLARDEAFFDSEKAQLIEYIDRTGSIQLACQEMGISYSKSTNMIKRAEKELGFKLLERWSGGTSGGGSRMTKEAKEFMRRYWELLEHAQNVVDELFEEYFAADHSKEKREHKGQ